MSSARLSFALFLVAGLLATGACSRGETPDAAMRRGDALFAQKQYRPAAQAYRLVLGAQPANEKARTALGRALALSGDPVRAADLLPDDRQVQLDAAIAKQAKFRFQDAATLATRLLTADPDNARAMVVLADVTAALPNTVWPMSELAGRLGDPPRFDGIRRGARPDMSRNDDNKAEALYKRALERQPDLLDARLAYANFLWTTGRPRESEPWLRAAAEQAPDHPVANYALGALYASMGRTGEAAAFLARASQAEGPGRRSATLMMADRDQATGDAADARAMLQSMLDTDDQDGEVALRLAALDAETGREADAARLLTRLLARKPGLAAAHIMRARLLYQQGNPDQRFARQALDIAPGSSEAHMLLGHLLVDAGQTDQALDEFRDAARRAPGDVQPLLALARVSLDEGRLPQALSHARAAVRLAPEDREANLVLVAALIAAPALNEAATALAALAARHPNDAEVAVVQGRLALARGNTADARSAFTRALEARADARDALEGLVTAEGTLVSPATQRRIEAAAQTHPSDPDLRLLLGRVYHATNDLPRAEAALVQAQGLNPSHVAVALELAAVLRDAHKADAAAGVLERILARRPARIAEVREALAAIYQVQGRRADMQRQFEQLVVEAPGAVEPSIALAAMYVEQNDKLPRALELAMVAKRARPDDPDVDLLLGRIYIARKLGGLAVSALERATSTRPANATYHYQLGVALELAGNLSRARTEYAQALQLDPRLPDADHAREMAAGRR